MASKTPAGTAQPVVLGRRSAPTQVGSHYHFYDGTIGEFRFYTRALSFDEIGLLYAEYDWQ